MSLEKKVGNFTEACDGNTVAAVAVSTIVKNLSGFIGAIVSKRNYNTVLA